MKYRNESVARTAETAEALGVSDHTVREGVRRGEIPDVGPGRTVRIPRVWIDERLGDSAGITTPAEAALMPALLAAALRAAADVLDSGREDLAST